MPEPEEHHVFFAVVGFEEHPREISLIAGIEPDDASIAGAPFTDVRALYRCDSLEATWIAAGGGCTSSGPCGRHYHVYSGITGVEWGISRFFFMDHPAFYLSAELIDACRALDPDIGFDQPTIGAGPDFPAVSADIPERPDDEDES